MVLVAKPLRSELGRYAVSLPLMDAQVNAMVRCMKCPGGPWDVGVMLTTDDHIHQLNKRYRKKDKPTDVLSFPAHKITRPGRFPRVRSIDDRYLGDIFLSLPYIQHQCEQPEKNGFSSLNERLPELFAHGLCHLLGYDHEEDDDYELMQRAENYLLDTHTRYLPTKFQ